MITEALKKIFKNTLSNAIKDQINYHNKNGNYFTDITFIVGNYYDGIRIRAYLKTSNPAFDAYDGSNARYFYDNKVDTWVHALDKIS